MVKYSFSVDDKNKTMQILLQDEMVDLANRLGLMLTVSYKDFGESRTSPREEKKQKIKASIKDWKHRITDKDLEKAERDRCCDSC